MNSRTILVWFRNDLRLHDNEILVRALENDNHIVPVYCFDPHYFDTTPFSTKKTGALRAKFLIQNVKALKQAFQQLGGDLHVAFGNPEDVLPELCETYGIAEVYHHREVAFEETRTSEAVETALWKKQINLRHYIGHTLFHKEDLPFPIKDIPDTFSVFKKKAERESFVRPQLEVPTTFRFPNNGFQATEVPDLAQLGYSPEEIQLAQNSPEYGGESQALALLADFHKEPAEHAYESKLSAYIATGALSPNTFYQHLINSPKIADNRKLLEAQLTKLFWRDYFRFMFKKHGNAFFKYEGLSSSTPELNEDEAWAFNTWTKAQTDLPQVNEAMDKLNRTGLLSIRERQLLASYFVHVLKGNWLWGAAWFEEKLLDYNPTSNYGNWAHIAGVGSSEKDNKPLSISKITA